MKLRKTQENDKIFNWARKHFKKMAVNQHYQCLAPSERIENVIKLVNLYKNRCFYLTTGHERDDRTSSYDYCQNPKQTYVSSQVLTRAYGI